MKKYIFLYGLFCILFLAACRNQQSPVNPNATKEAEELLNYLYSIKGEKILSGQHNYSHELLRSTDSVIAITGKTPKIWGSDFLGTAETRQNLVNEAIRQYKAGSIITLMYHQVKPFDPDSLGFSGSVKGRVADDQWEQIVTPETEFYNMLIEKIG